MKFKIASSLFIAPIFLAQIASAHISFIDAKPLVAGKSFKATFAIPHGCEGTATTKITIQIPEGIIAAKPMPKADWNLTTEINDYAKSYQQYGKEVTKGATSVTWEGLLPDAHYDEFTVTGYFAENTGKFKKQIFFPIIQTCETGEFLWTDTSGHHHHGHDAKELGAPSLKVQQ